MSLEQVLGVIKRNWKGFFLAGVFFGTLSFFLLVVTQKSLKATTDLLVVQNNGNITDYYTMSKSTDYLSGILIESVYSEKFLEEMGKKDETVIDFLPSEKAERLTAWQKTVDLKKNANAAIITMEILGDSSKQLSKTSSVLTDVLTNQYSLFLGQGQNIEIKVLSGPIIEKNPTMSQIFLVSFGGFGVGFLLVVLWAFYREGLRDETSLHSFRKNTTMISQNEIREGVQNKQVSGGIFFHDPSCVSDNRLYQ